ncbi:hypothetical protein [Actinoplanes sp. RD1]|uniref:hypothetical protein n=1 Tax=Actinoplanes sp. RD1 TaxID=3064538 RepID=UPI002741E708|nr:hypothetical protein [Actinoplanes sp. RD1]
MQVVPLAGLVGSGLVGVTGAAGVTVGGFNYVRALRQIRADQRRYDRRHAEHRSRVSRTNKALRSYGRLQERAHHDVILRMKAFLERNGAQVRAADHLVVDGVEPPALSVAPVAKFDVNAGGWARGAVKAVAAGTGTAEVIKAVVLRFGKASTGRPVSALSGIAQKNAGDSWLGGGPLSTGAGGKALGNKVRIAMVGSAAAFSAGLTTLEEGSLAHSQAAEHHQIISARIGELQLQDELLRGVRLRAEELGDFLAEHMTRAAAALDVLESEPFNPAEHRDRLDAARHLVVGVQQIRTAPISDGKCRLDPTTEHLIIKYRRACEDNSDA